MKRYSLWAVLFFCSVAAFAALSDQPKKYTEGTFPTGRDLQANIEWLFDEIAQTSEAATAALASVSLTVATNTANIAAIQASLAGTDSVATIAKTNTASASQLFVWSDTGLTYIEPISGEGTFRYVVEYAYAGAGAFRGGGRLEGAIAYSPGSGTYVIDGPVSLKYNVDDVVDIVATHSSVATSSSVRFGLIASFPGSISFTATARARFVGSEL